MRSASFFLLSVAVHAAALAYPVTFAAHNDAEAIRVTVIPVEPESRAGGGSDSSTPIHSSNSRFAARPGVATSVQSKPAIRAGRQRDTTEVVTISDGTVAMISALPTLLDEVTNAISGPESHAPQRTETGTDGTGTGGNGHGGYAAGSGHGSGKSAGTGFSASTIIRSQPRYRDTPRPDYPESARRAGREGRVLLRVLVDDQGRSKRVEINGSSGSDALDRAAIEAIKLWRFYPARAGDQPIESWVSIPIEFQLTDLRN